MKKLITAIAAIATSFGLFAADAFTTSVLSDIQSKTNNLVVGYDTTGATMLDDTGDVTVNWFADSLKTDFTTKMETYEQPELKVGEDEEGPYKYLAIDTDVGDPVLRTFNNVVEDTGVDNFKYNNIAISDHGVFIDTETTFTLFDTVPDAPGDSKILVWARETEADEDAGIAGATNLMVSCGTIDPESRQVVPTNYVLDVNGIVPEQMYRLTIRADKDGANNTKFRVYLNGVQLKTVPLDDQDTTLDEFPSLVDRTQELGAAGFGGTGSLKGIDLLTEDDAPAQVPFAIDPTYLTVNWDAGVKSFTFAGETYNVSGLDYTSTNILVTTTGETLTMTATFEELKKTDWWDSSIVVDFDQSEEDEDTPLASATFSVTRYAKGSEITIISQDDVTAGTLIVDDVTIGGFSTLNKLIDKLDTIAVDPSDFEGNVQIIIGADTVVDENFGVKLHNYELAKFTIDLAGHKITGETESPAEDFYVIQNFSEMTITDSVGGGAIIAGTGFEGAVYNEWNLTLDASADPSKPIVYDGSIDNDIVFDGDDQWCLINGGLFSEKPDMTIAGVSLGSGLGWEEQTEAPYDGWWLVVPQGSFTLSLTAGDGNQITSDPAAGSIAEDTPVVVTVTPDPGYQFADESYDGWEKVGGNLVSNFTMTADVSITAPDATAIPVTLTITKGEGVASVTYTVNGDAPGATVKIGDVIKITDVTYATGYEADGTYVKDYEYTVVAADVTAGSISWTVGAKKQTFTVTVDASNATLSTNGAPVAASSFTAEYGTVFTLTATAADGYKDAKIKIGGEEKSTLTVTENVTIVVTATQMATWTVTVDATLGEHVLSVTPDPASVREDAASKTITLSATFESGYKRAYFTVDGVQIEGNTFEITKSVTVNAVAQAEQTDPTPVDPSQGTIVSDGEGNFVITPAADVTEITVQNAGDNNFIVDVPTDFTIKGVAAGKITVKCNGEDITAVCKGGNAEGFSTELDPTQTTPELIEATATEQPLVVGTTVDLKIKQSVAGLAYRLLRVGEVGDFSDSAKITTAATMKGDGETLTLTDANKPANKAFYKVAVGKDVIND